MTVLEEIAAERQRQIEEEGWTPKHDDRNHPHGELAIAAACYAAPTAVLMEYPEKVMRGDSRRLVWPWDREWWKPKDERRNLIRSAALLVARIEQIDRKAARENENVA